MAKPASYLSDRCSYKRQRCRHQLLLATWLTCSGFTWPGRVPHLSYQAAHGSVQERVEALRALEGYPDQASRDACLAGLEDSASEVRAQAAQCVGATKDERAATNLLDLADAKAALERAAALQALGRIAPARALPSIERALADARPAVQIAAVRALDAYVRDGSFELAKLAPLLKAEQAEVRLAAVELLPVTPALAQPAAGARALQLRAAARDAQAEVRAAALRVMGQVRDASHLPDLRAASSDADEAVRLAAIAALGDSNLAGAAAALRELSAASATPRSARTALAALGRIDDPSALPPLAAALARPELTPSAASALVARALRIHQPQSYEQTTSALQHAIEVLTRDTAALGADQAAFEALASALVELAGVCDVRSAALSLLRALQAGRGEVVSLTGQLLSLVAVNALGIQPLMAALLARDPSAPRLPDALVSVLVASADAPRLLAAQREPLQRVADAHPQALELHALLRVAHADTSPEARRALTALWAEQPALAADPDQLARLVRWLDDADAEVREHSSVALGRAAGLTALEHLSARLERNAPHPELTLRACAGALLRLQPPNALRERLLQQFQSYLSKPDEQVAMSAVHALRAAREQRSAPWIAGLLRGSSPQLRAAAIQALAGFTQPEARRMLRDMLRGDNAHNASNAALALAELGSDRDVEALLRAAERGSWPLPPAAAYAAARITARGVTRKHSLERVLCRFAQLRDSYVLSNIVSALATLGADACDEQIQPARLLAPGLPSALRAAAALWLQSTRPHSAEENAERSALLARCASDHDEAVAAACRPNATPQEQPGHTLLSVLAPDAHSPLANRVVALRHPDGTVFVGQSDNTGRLYLPRAAAHELRLEDPADHGALALPARKASMP